MKVTTKYNILMTLAFLGYIILLSPFLEDDSTPLILDSICGDSVTWTLIISSLSLILSTIVLMMITRSLWNRLFPNLCGWKNLSYAESYALSLIFSMFTVAL